MRNINSTLLNKGRTSIFIAHRLRTIVESGMSSPEFHIHITAEIERMQTSSLCSKTGTSPSKVPTKICLRKGDYITACG
jgi:hypothetical protein